MILDNEKNILNFINHWESNENNKKYSFFNTALMRDIIPLITTKNFYKKPSDNKKKIFQFRLPTLILSLQHVYWVFFWTMKWILFSRKLNNSKIILAALGSNRKLTLQYFNSLLNVINNHGIKIVSLNVPCFGKLLFNKKIFYLPRFFYHRSNSKDRAQIMETFSNLLSELSHSLDKYYNSVEFDKKLLALQINRYFNDSTALKSFISKKNIINNILCLIQDFDNSTNKVLYYNIANQNDIKTLVIDHSINTHPFLGNNRYSDFILCWGKYSFSRSKLMGIEQKKIIVGSPKYFHWRPHKIKKNNRILYIASAYKHPSFPLGDRDIKLTQEYINKITNNVHNDKIYKVYFKPHPEDGKKFWLNIGLQNEEKIQVINKNIEVIIDKVDCVLVEDTTVILDLLSIDIPIIYLADNAQNDYWDLKKKSGILFCKSPTHLEEVLHLSKNYKVTMEVRKDYFNKFIQSDLNFDNNLIQFFNKNIFENLHE